MQCRISNANISIDISSMMNALTTQLGTSCSFDSPGLARNEP
ncbi:MAG: tetrahydrofolate synthase, partial [Prevotella salivae]|nr:tetrahydrofolate synthase [Segatella salivae]